MKKTNTDKWKECCNHF